MSCTPPTTAARQDDRRPVEKSQIEYVLERQSTSRSLSGTSFLPSVSSVSRKGRGSHITAVPHTDRFWVLRFLPRRCLTHVSCIAPDGTLPALHAGGFERSALARVAGSLTLSTCNRARMRPGDRAGQAADLHLDLRRTTFSLLVGALPVVRCVPTSAPLGLARRPSRGRSAFLCKFFNDFARCPVRV